MAKTQPEPAGRKTESIPVSIRVTPERQLIIEPKSLTLKASAYQEAAWKCPDGTLEIRFATAQTPFRGGSYRAPQNTTTLSGVPERKKVRREAYRYVVVVTTRDVVLVSQEQEIIVT